MNGTDAPQDSPVTSQVAASREVTVQETVLPPMTFRLPHGMHAIEVPLDGTSRAEAARRLVRDIYPRGTEPLWQSMGALYGAMADELSADGVAFFGVGLYAVDGGGVAHCSLTIAVYESGTDDQDVAAQGVHALLLDDPLREVTWLDLPCGPAVSAITFRKLVVDASYTASGKDEDLVMGQIQVHIPFPTGHFTALVTLDTASMDQWEDFSAALAGIVGSVEFPIPVGADDRSD